MRLVRKSMYVLQKLRHDAGPSIVSAQAADKQGLVGAVPFGGTKAGRKFHVTVFIGLASIRSD